MFNFENWYSMNTHIDETTGYIIQLDPDSVLSEREGVLTLNKLQSLCPDLTAITGEHWSCDSRHMDQFVSHIIASKLQSGERKSVNVSWTTTRTANHSYFIALKNHNWNQDANVLIIINIAPLSTIKDILILKFNKINLSTVIYNV